MAEGTGRDKRVRLRSSSAEQERSQRQVRALRAARNGLLGLGVLVVGGTLVLGLSGHFRPAPAGELLRFAGVIVIALGVALHTVVDFMSGRTIGPFIGFSRQGWRWGAPVWGMGIASLAAGQLLAH